LNIYLDLFLTFARIGGLTFGGGYAMLPMLQKEVVEKRGWATNEELMDYYAVSQCTPGVIAVNTATFVGTKIKGIIGGICATLGVVSPSVVIISIIALFLENFRDLKVVSSAFAGISVAVAVLIFNAVLKLWKSNIKNKAGIILFVIALLITLFIDLSPVYIIVAGALYGIISGKMQKKEGK